MNRTPSIAALGALLLLGAVPARAQSVTIAPGQSPRDALLSARIGAEIAARRAATPHAAAAPGSRPPALLSGTILSTSLTVGDPTSLAAMNIRFRADSSGLVAAVFDFTSPSGGSSLSVSYFPSGHIARGSVTFTDNFTLPGFTEPGNWTLTSAAIYAYDGSLTQYTAQQAAKLVQPASITVVNNGPVDIQPPAVRGGKVLTPSVSLSAPLPQFAASITASDAVSGYDQAYIIIQPPGSSFGYTNLVSQAFPIKSGSFTTVADLPGGYGPGTWGINGYGVCDLAGNCLFDQTPADVQALFGTTTFTVTQ